MKRAAGQLANFNDERLFKDASEGIALIVDNATKFDDAGRCLHQSGNCRASTIMRGFAEEEAAKVLILIDLVRCPRRFNRRNQVAKRFYGHVAKRIYAMTCDYPRISSFKEFRQLVNAESRPYYLDGPNWVDWVFVNSIVADREQTLYVDFVQNLNPEEGEHYWNAPFEPSPAPRHYETPKCVALSHALSELGAKSPSGLSAIAQVWRGFEPEPGTDRGEIHNLNRRTLEELERCSGTTRDERAEQFITRVWSFPLWSLEIREPRGKRGVPMELLEERKRTIEWIEETEAKRDPPPAINRTKVEELSNAYAAWSSDVDAIVRKTAPKSGFHFRSTEEIGRDFEQPSYARVEQLFRALTETEKAALLALGWFDKERVGAHWTRIHARATSAVSTLDEDYHLSMGGHWLGGLERWEQKPKPFTSGRLRSH